MRPGTLLRPTLAALALALTPVLASGSAGAPRAETVTVFAAASLAGALDDVAADWQAATGHRAVLSFAGSAALARQIQAGAPADIFISAGIDWIEAAKASGDLQPDTIRNVLGNSLVLIAHDADAAPVQLGPDLDLVALLGDGRLAIAMVDAVPAGIYGRAALESLGLWQGAAPRLAQTENVRAALALVIRGEAPYGIVYATDALAAGDAVTVVAAFAPETHPPIRYAAAITAQSTSPAAQSFLDALTEPAAQARFAARGFTMPD